MLADSGIGVLTANSKSLPPQAAMHRVCASPWLKPSIKKQVVAGPCATDRQEQQARCGQKTHFLQCFFFAVARALGPRTAAVPAMKAAIARRRSLPPLRVVIRRSLCSAFMMDLSSYDRRRLPHGCPRHHDPKDVAEFGQAASRDASLGDQASNQ
jgi:hypothetical protein